MSSSSQALAALQSLFEPTYLAIQPDPELPHQLDDKIITDTAASWDFVSYRWYRGVDTHGVHRIFRFQRGLALEQWHALLRFQTLESVVGPFRTQLQAQAAPR